MERSGWVCTVAEVALGSGSSFSVSVSGTPSWLVSPDGEEELDSFLCLVSSVVAGMSAFVAPAVAMPLPVPVPASGVGASVGCNAASAPKVIWSARSK